FGRRGRARTRRRDRARAALALRRDGARPRRGVLPRPRRRRHACRLDPGSRRGRRQRPARRAGRRGGARRRDRPRADGARPRRAARRGRARACGVVAPDAGRVRRPRPRPRMRMLVFVTQQADPEHPVLGATAAQIAALAARVDEVLVLANGPVADGLPANCRVRSFAAPSKLGRTSRYLRALIPALAPRPVAVLAHMSPVYAVVAAPLARPLGVPVLLWFTQAGGGRLLRVAEPLVSAILTVDRRTVPLESKKVRAIGHGIDVSAFRVSGSEPQATLRLLGLGRYAPVKGWDVA